MKNIMRSLPMKFTAFVIIIVCVFFVCHTTVKNIADYDNIYQFEENFEASNKLAQPVYNAISYLRSALPESSPSRQEHYFSAEEIASRLDTFHVDYYISYGDYNITNTQIDSPEYYSESIMNFVLYKTNGSVNSFNTFDTYYYPPDADDLDADTDYTILLKIQDAYADELHMQWNTGREIVNKVFTFDMIMFAAALLAFIYLLWVCGKQSGSDDIHMLLIDRMYVEINILIIIGSVIGMCALVLCGIDAVFNGFVPDFIFTLISLAAAAGTALVLCLVFSLVRNIKNETFMSRSLIKIIFCFTWKPAKRFFSSLFRLFSNVKLGIMRICSNKTSFLIAVLIAVYTLVLAVLTAFMYNGSFAAFIFTVLLFVGTCIYVSNRLKGFDDIRKGIFEIRNGNLNYKINECSSITLNDMARAVNSIGDGLSASVSQELKAERMKSELITNVSHDLKTPLTSIINYSDLLCKSELLPNEANEYAEIINQKALRLKTLTTDLFDISKVQSVNDEIIKEKIDISTLLNQSLAELDENIKSSSLDFHISLPENELFISADGKKLSRVFENLIGNALKYSLPCTRVYINAYDKNGIAFIEIKNISSYPMDFDDDEITERFVRGDKSRTSEGSGLGLAIAKSYVQACGGSFKIVTDGDLFKAVITFEKKQ